MTHPLAPQLAAALRRVEPYLDLLPETAAAQVREAIEAWRAYVAIVQTPVQPGEKER